MGGGAVTTITGLITLLATAQALGVMLPDNESAQLGECFLYHTFQYK